MSSTTTGTGTTDPGDRSAAEIERDVEATRAGLTDTLEQLRDKASPAQLFEQAVDWARSSGGSEMLHNLGAQVRGNPLPLLLIGAGIGWMMLSGGGGRREHGGADAGRTLALPPPDHAGASGQDGPPARVRSYPSASAAAGETGDGPGLTERASEAVSGAARDVADASRAVADSVAGAARGLADGVGGAAGRAGDGIGAATADVGRSALETGRAMRGQAEQGLGWILREQPLVLGAVGVALGAAVGALLPGTETEDRLMGETRDALVDQAAGTAQQGYERLKDTAGEHLGRAQQAVGDAAARTGGLSHAGEALGEAAREVRHAVGEAARDLAGEAKSAMGAAGEGRVPSPPPEPPGPRGAGPA